MISSPLGIGLGMGLSVGPGGGVVRSRDYFLTDTVQDGRSNGTTLSSSTVDTPVGRQDALSGLVAAYVAFESVKLKTTDHLDSATLTVDVSQVAGTPNVTVYAFPGTADEPPPAADFRTSLDRTTASFKPESWSAGLNALDVTALVYEVIQSEGWVSGSRITFILADDNYRILLSGSAAEILSWASKTAGGFTINSDNGGSTADVDWMVLR